MLKFLRISSAYPSFLQQFEDQNIRKLENYDYKKSLEIYFEENYSVSNNISNELKKLD